MEKSSSQNIKDKLIHLGACGRPHGVTGDFSASLLNPDGGAIKKGVSLLLVPKSPQSSLPTEGELYTVKAARFGNKAILRFEGVEGRNQVEEMVPFDIYIRRSDLPAPEEGEFYLEDLIGLEARDPAGREIGAVKSYFDNGAQIVLAVKKKHGIRPKSC